MCLNCGCGMWDDDMGKPDNLTLTKVAEAANAADMDAKNTLEYIKAAASEITPQELEKKMQQLKDK